MEFVFVVPRTELFPESSTHGLSLFGGHFREHTFRERCARQGFFVERDYAERTPSLKQVIPYSIVVRPGLGTESEVLCLRRTRKGGEARLHDKYSIGVGGHINPVDLPAEPDAGVGRFEALVRAATQREVAQEELIIEGRFDVRPVGLLNDDSNPVGAVHVGLVQLITVDGPVRVREVDQLEGRFVSLTELRKMLANTNFESWSSLLIEDLDTILSESIATPS